MVIYGYSCDKSVPIYHSYLLNVCVYSYLNFCYFWLGSFLYSISFLLVYNTCVREGNGYDVYASKFSTLQSTFNNLQQGEVVDLMAHPHASIMGLNLNESQ